MKSILLLDGIAEENCQRIKDLIKADEDLVRVYSKKNINKLLESEYIIENELGKYFDMDYKNIVIETTNYFVIPSSFNYGSQSGESGKIFFIEAMTGFSKDHVEVNKLLMMINSRTAIELDFIVK